MSATDPTRQGVTMYDNIRELAFFLRVSEEASFSAAARSLDLDPSTISKVVQRMENRLGLRLFHRTSRVLKLTQEGERFLSAAQKVMQALQEAEAALSPAMTEASGVLRVSSTPSFARTRLAPLMPAFVEKYPRLQVQFVLSPTPPELFEQQIDLSFQNGVIPDSTLVARRVSSTRWRICASPDYLRRSGIPRSLDDLSKHHCLNFMPGSYRSQWVMSEGGNIQKLHPEARLTANNGDMLCALAVSGLGLARLADYHVASEIAAGRLTTVLDEQACDTEPIYAVYPSRRHLSVRVRAFLEHVEQHLGGA